MILQLEITWILLIVLILIVFSYISFILFIVLFTDKKYFNKRMPNKYHLRCRDANEYKNLKFENFSFYSKKNKLYGKIYYYNKQYKNIIIFSNGYNILKEKYLPIIEVLVSLGYTVFSYDYTGTMDSEGKTFKGMPQAIIDLECCINYVKENYPDSEIILMGHSMGAYASCNVLNVSKVKKVVAIAPVNHVANIICDNIYQTSGKTIFGFNFMFRLLLNIRFKKYGSYETYQTLKYVDTDVLVIHGTEDKTVLVDRFIQFMNINNNAYVKQILLEGKQHEPLMTYPAMNYDLYLRHELQGLKLKYKNKIPNEEIEKINNSIDYNLKDQLDKEVLEKIIEFIKEV